MYLIATKSKPLRTLKIQRYTLLTVVALCFSANNTMTVNAAESNVSNRIGVIPVIMMGRVISKIDNFDSTIYLTERGQIRSSFTTVDCHNQPTPNDLPSTQTNQKHLKQCVITKDGETSLWM